MKKCHSCFYYGRGSRTCDYILITGTRRGCPIDDKCSRYLKGDGSVRKQPLALEGGRRGRKRDDARYRAIRALYDEGLNDVQIGERVGLSRGAIYNWRQREGLPANARGGRNIRGGS